MGIQVEGVGRVAVSRELYDFTRHQDLRLTAGYHGHVDHLGTMKLVR